MVLAKYNYTSQMFLQLRHYIVGNFCHWKVLFPRLVRTVVFIWCNHW